MVVALSTIVPVLITIYFSCIIAIAVLVIVAFITTITTAANIAIFIVVVTIGIADLSNVGEVKVNSAGFMAKSTADGSDFNCASVDIAVAAYYLDSVVASEMLASVLNCEYQKKIIYSMHSIIVIIITTITITVAEAIITSCSSLERFAIDSAFEVNVAKVSSQQQYSKVFHLA